MNNNLPQSKNDAKQAYLSRQRADMISRFKQSDENERAAIMNHIDGILPVLSGDEKTFWLKVRRDLEKLGEGSSLKIQLCKNAYCWKCTGRLIRLTGARR